MSREILFRGKRIDGGGWAEGDLIYGDIKKLDFGKTKGYSQSDYDCGNCGGATIDINSHFNYCPNCGYSVIK